MATKIIMPKSGMDMVEGKIIKWLKEIGDPVEKDEAVAEIETDKVNMEVESFADGYLIEKIAKEGDVVPVTEVIGYIGEKDEKIKKTVAKEPKEKKSSSKTGDKNAYDIVVIGGGPAGYIAAIKAARLGKKTALVEKSVVGGTCLNRGCIPTKTYLKSSEIIESISHASLRGINIANSKVLVDMKKVVDEKNKVVKQLTGGVAALLKSNGVEVFNGKATVKKDRTILIDNKEKIKTDKLIYAGGSKATKINIPGINSKLVLTSDEILDLEVIPEKLAIIGGGVIGVEMATCFKSFGADVTIIELEKNIVPTMDKDISNELKKSLKKKGINILNGTRLEEIKENKSKLELITDKEMIEADMALLSIGRSPDLEGLKDIDIETFQGRIKVDNKMQSSKSWIYAPGDINGKMMLAHAAFKMGEVAALNASGFSEKVNLNNVPSCIYTMPEVGCVGITEAEAREKYDVSIGRFPFAANGRALASGEGNGFVKVITDKKYGEVLGVHIIGPSAAEMINEAAALMHTEITAKEIADIIHGHPTYSESLMEAVADSLDECLHLPRK